MSDDLVPRSEPGHTRPIVALDAEHLARQLDATGYFRTARRILPPIVEPGHALCFDEQVAVLVDIETSVSDSRQPEVIEIAMVAVVVDADGRPGPVIGLIEQLQEPSRPISAMTVNLTGLTDAAVAGCRFDLDAIGAMLARADFVVAHNAARDRPLLERLHGDFAFKPWACSCAEIAWGERGCDSARLANLAAHFGWFFRPHRATEDCVALLAVLSATTPQHPRPAFVDLVAAIKREAVQIDAIAVPFALKDRLKRRHYRWVFEVDGSPAAWRTEVAREHLDAELAWLDRHIYAGGDVSPLTRTVTAVDRYRDG